MGLLMTNRWILGTAVGVLAVQAQVAVAAPSLEQCRALQDAQARLACYDALSGPSVPLDPVARKEEQKKNFGLSERQKAPEERNEVEEVQGKISEVSGSTFVLDNGQQWRVTSTRNIHDRLRPGQAARIERGTMSGNRLHIEGMTGMETVRRIN
jgi:hypothetical protein